MIDLLNLISRKTAIIDSPTPTHTHLSHKHMKTIVQFLRSVACLFFYEPFRTTPFSAFYNSKEIFTIVLSPNILGRLEISWNRLTR